MNNKSKNNGITLIALVITIIVLLILAGVTIAAISGNEGTANKAQDARNKTEIANAKEQVKLLSAGYIQEFYEKKYVKNESVAQANKGEYILYKLNEIGTYGNYQFQVDTENKKISVYTTEGKALIEGKVNDNGTIEWNEETTGGDIPPVVPVVVNPTSIAIANKSGVTEIDINGTVELEATAEPAGASGTITWNCDIEGAVEFSEATGITTTITGKTAGKIKITATIGSLTSNEIEITIKEPIVEMTVTFDPNGGGTPSPSTITKNVGEALGTLPTVSRTNYNFDGWYTAASGGILISSETQMPGTETTYYAHWSLIQVTATFNPNGGETPSPSTITKGIGETLGTLPTVSRSGYDFAGWYTAASGGSQISSSTTMPSTAPTYYAHWTVTQATVTFNANGGSGTMAAATVDSTKAINTLSNSFTAPTGYTFEGWASSSTSHTVLTGEVKNNRTVYAIWKCAGTGYTCTSGSSTTCKGKNWACDEVCGNCGYVAQGTYNENGVITWGTIKVCPNCNTEPDFTYNKCHKCGEVTWPCYHFPCAHGYSSSHTSYTYCSHNYTSKHSYCSHNKTSTHYYK